MSEQQKFSAGVYFISSIYNKRLNGQPFNRALVKSAVNIFKKIGFKHVGNEGALVILEYRTKNVTHIIKIGKQDETSFFEHTVIEQKVLAAF